MEEFSGLHERVRIRELHRRHVMHDELWDALGPMIENGSALSCEEIGRSYDGRPLRLIRFGRGPTPVLLWSQMHGDEGTGTRALADLIRLLAEVPEHPITRSISQHLTLLVLPMLNPDGAVVNERRNAQGIDINRDAQARATPEGRALWDVIEKEQPAVALDLHDEMVLKRVDETDRQVAVSLQATLTKEGQEADEAPRPARCLAAAMLRTIEPLVGGHIARYPAKFEPQTFGTPIAQRGITSVLFELGGWRDDPQKEYLRMVSFVAVLAALDRITRGDVEEEDPSAYDALPENGSTMTDLLIEGGTLVLPGREPYRADVAVDFRDPLERRGGRIIDVGDLEKRVAFERIDASGLYLHPLRQALRHVDEAAPDLGVELPASFVARRGESDESDAAWLVDEGKLREVAGDVRENT